MQFSDFQELLWKWGARQQGECGYGWKGPRFAETAGDFDYSSTIPHFEEEVGRVEAIIERYAARPENGDRARALFAKYGASREFYDASRARLTASQIAERLGMSRPSYSDRVSRAEDAVFTAYLELWVYRHREAV